MSDNSPMIDLTTFQQVTLAVIASKDKPHGLAVKEDLEEIYQKDVGHGRVYPNMSELAEMGLITKGQKDLRTNEYSITARGKRELRAHIDWLQDSLQEEAIAAD